MTLAVKAKANITTLTAPNGATVRITTKYGELLIQAMIDRLLNLEQLSDTDRQLAAERRYQLVQ